jgi:ATP/ADP translocase
MTQPAPKDAEASAWAGRLVVGLATFWAFVMALLASWLVERAGLLEGAAFTWTMRIVTAAVTVAAFLLSPALGRRAGPRALAPLAIGCGLSVAVALAFLFLVLSNRVGG